ncbi:hypothetical protein [Micromonospora sp. WMMB482]|uniref:hypothetical protein n=1 Tax=Micromonospora sp. WMMB482 TaxID=2849653 RepID=UPI0020B2046D|nr:hypothetical protein [Micromonospora sp. WMMB482]
MQTVFSTVLPDMPRGRRDLAGPARRGRDSGRRADRPAVPVPFRLVERISDAARPSSIERAERTRVRDRERIRYADEMAVAASRATATAERSRAGC